RPVQRSEAGVQEWGQRYLQAGGEGLYDLSRAHSACIGAAPIREELPKRGFTPIRRSPDP
ncbi:MAG TPA: hypothetical protein VJ785_07440, partial [Anaerolineales bacterium]|nr:hypothetical protein [Anaerolineales bacterium]